MVGDRALTGDRALIGDSALAGDRVLAVPKAGSAALVLDSALVMDSALVGDSALAVPRVPCSVPCPPGSGTACRISVQGGQEFPVLPQSSPALLGQVQYQPQPLPRNIAILPGLGSGIRL